MLVRISLFIFCFTFSSATLHAAYLVHIDRCTDFAGINCFDMKTTALGMALFYNDPAEYIDQPRGSFVARFSAISVREIDFSTGKRAQRLNNPQTKNLSKPPECEQDKVLSFRNGQQMVRKTDGRAVTRVGRITGLNGVAIENPSPRQAIALFKLNNPNYKQWPEACFDFSSFDFHPSAKPANGASADEPTSTR